MGELEEPPREPDAKKEVLRIRQTGGMLQTPTKAGAWRLERVEVDIEHETVPPKVWAIWRQV